MSDKKLCIISEVAKGSDSIKRAVLGLFACVLLIGCAKDNQPVREDIGETVVEHTSETTELQDYIEDFDKGVNEYTLSNEKASVRLVFPSDAGVNANASSSMLETTFNDAYIVFELTGTLEEALAVNEAFCERMAEKDGDNYDTSVSFKASKQEINGDTVYFSRYSLTDGSFHCWYFFLPIENGCLAVTYQPQGDVPTNEAVLSDILSVID